MELRGAGQPRRGRRARAGAPLLHRRARGRAQVELEAEPEAAHRPSSRQGPRARSAGPAAATAEHEGGGLPRRAAHDGGGSRGAMRDGGACRHASAARLTAADIRRREPRAEQGERGQAAATFAARRRVRGEARPRAGAAAAGARRGPEQQQPEPAAGREIELHALRRRRKAGTVTRRHQRLQTSAAGTRRAGSSGGVQRRISSTSSSGSAGRARGIGGGGSMVGLLCWCRRRPLEQGRERNRRRPLVASRCWRQRILRGQGKDCARCKTKNASHILAHVVGVSLKHESE